MLFAFVLSKRTRIICVVSEFFIIDCKYVSTCCFDGLHL
jgi:hypothetical protein